MTDRTALLAEIVDLRAKLERLEQELAGDTAPSSREAEIAAIRSECEAKGIAVNEHGRITTMGYARLTGRTPKAVRNRRSKRKDKVPSVWVSRSREYAVEDIADQRIKEREASQ